MPTTCPVLWSAKLTGDGARNEDVGVNDERFLFVGTYTDLGAEGIYTCRLNVATGAVECIDVQPGIQNPTFLTVDPSGEHLYAASEQVSGDGVLKAYAIDRHGSLELLNTERTGGAGPCHVQVDRTDSYAVVANYFGGSVSLLPIRADGSLGPRTDFVQHHGSSVHPERQRQAHAHCVMIDRANALVYACDLGMDAIVVYRIDHVTGRLIERPDLAVHAEPGDGPRHFTLHPAAASAYAVNELGSSVSAYAYDAETGALTVKQRVSTLPAAWSGDNTCADIHVSPDGRFLYASNRGHNSIAAFAVESGTGRLAPLGHTPTRGEIPRNFLITPDGRFLLAANQNSGNIVTFRVDEDSGRLEFTGHESEVPAPVCLKLAPLRE